MIPVRGDRSRAIVVAVIGTLAVTVYAAVAAVQILVLNPLAAAAPLDLSEIHDRVAAAGESFNAEGTFVVLAAGVVIAVALLVITTLVRAPSPWLTAVLYLAVLVFGAPASFVAGFSPGMALGDTFGSAGGAGPGGRALLLVSAASLLAIAVLAVLRVVRERSATADGRAGA